MPQLKIPCTTTEAWCSQINKYFLKKNNNNNKRKKTSPHISSPLLSILQYENKDFSNKLIVEYV